MFSSPTFLFYFLPLVLGLYVVLPWRLRNPLLLLASLLFYAWQEQEIVFALLGSVLVNFLLGGVIARSQRRGERGVAARAALVAAVVFNLGLLVVFKYANWIWDNLQVAATALGAGPGALPAIPTIHLPIGISFFTFQALSYVVDVWRREADAHRNPIHFATYIALFPQLVAGPIVRYRDIADQLLERRVDLAGFGYGVRRFVVGLGKKLLLADGVALVADRVFDLPAGEHGPALAWIGLVCYALQIYFDFSGYSDMAIGLGHMFGFRFLENFNYPYVARSVTEFWRRWHISLSSWFRDYLYIPLGGNRAGRGRLYFNLLVVFFLCGLWHGASWSFVVWGLFHGALLVVERLGLGRLLERLPAAFARLYLLVAVLIGWVFFRAPDLGYALDYVASLFGAPSTAPGVHVVGLVIDSYAWTVLVLGALGCVPWVPRLRAALDGGRGPWRAARARTGLEVAAAGGLLLVLFASAMKLAAGTYSPFIYFRF